MAILGKIVGGKYVSYSTPEQDAVADAKFAQMCANKSPPCINTDTTFMKGKLNDSGFGSSEAEQYMEAKYRGMAEAEGFNTKGKHYFGSIAERPGDPRAFQDTKAGVIEVAEERNMGLTIEGKRIRDSEQTEEYIDPEAKYHIDPEVVDEKITLMLGESPEMCETPRDLADLRETVTSDLETQLNKEPE